MLSVTDFSNFIYNFVEQFRKAHVTKIRWAISVHFQRNIKFKIIVNNKSLQKIENYGATIIVSDLSAIEDGKRKDLRRKNKLIYSL